MQSADHRIMDAMLIIGRALRVLLIAGQALWLAVSLYQTAITLLGQRKRPRTTKVATPRFGLIICARNEEAVIAGIIGDLHRQTYPADLTQILVVAHNCTDATATVARRAGALVLELTTEQTGKSHAVLGGLSVLTGLTEIGQPCDLIGVLDADSRVPEKFLEAVADASPDEACLQVETVPHGNGDWLADGYGFGRRARNVFWWRPREELGLGTTVSGSGFFMRRAPMERVLSQAKTITEDLETTAILAAEGVRVRYVGETYVEVEEPHQFGQSLQQRARWARGHLGVVRHAWPKVARQALRGDMAALDTAIFLLVPTRVLTRTAVTGSFMLSLAGSRAALPLPVVGVAMAGEWVVPVVIAVRARLLPLNLGGMRLAVRHGILSLLWFPVGLWALVTAAERRWDESPRMSSQDRDAVNTR